MPSPILSSPSVERRHWIVRGILAACSIPGLILVSAHVGFASLAKESGFSLIETVLMVGGVWALPANVVLIGAITSGASLIAAFFAVTLSSVRLRPMVVALVPEMKAEGTRKWVLYCLSHLVAVTSWVLAMEHLRTVPRAMRTAYYGGLGVTLVLINMAVVAIVHQLIGRLPEPVTAALLFLTPIYFLTSLWGSARERAGHVAMLFGLVLGPAFHVFAPQFDLLAAGLIGGGAAFIHHRAFGRAARP